MEDLQMKRTTIVAGLAMCCGIGVGLFGHGMLGAQQTTERRTVILTTDLEGMQGKELRIWRTEIGPGVVGTKHYHPGIECNYVLEGSLILEREGEAPVTMNAGDAQCARPRQVLVPRNASTTAPYKSVVFLIAEKGQPLAIPVK